MVTTSPKLAKLSTSTTITRSTMTTFLWHWPVMAGILLLAAILHFFRLTQEGYANLYYAAAVKSMLTGWHNFFFVSFDAGGFVSVDKPPLGLWVQAISAMVFGFSGLSLLLPQALAGVLSVGLLYHLVARVFGRVAGLLAALTLAVTPISIAANRNNTMDSLLVFTLLLAAWAISRAVEKGQLRWLLFGSVLVGLGFNIKMLQAFLVLPAFYLLYLLVPPLAWWKRLLHLTLVTVVLLVVSLAWAVVVDLTPPDQRPFVGSSKDNTVMELIIGHNGLSRLLPGGLRYLIGPDGSSPSSPGQPPLDGPARFAPGQPQAQTPGGPPPGPPPHLAQPGAQPGQAPLGSPPAGPNIQPPPPGAPGQPPQPAPAGGQLNQTPFPRPPVVGQPGGPPSAGGPPGSGQPGGPTTETGEPSLLRLFNRQLAGQISWFLPLAGLGGLVAAWPRTIWPRFSLKRQRQALLLWGMWLLPQVVFFSMASLFHRYYLEMLAPATAALVGAGMVALWHDYRQTGWRGWLLPVALLGSAGLQVYILADFPEWSVWLTPLVVGLTVVVAVAFIVLRITCHVSRVTCHASPLKTWLAKMLTVIGMLILLIAPTVWAVIPVWYAGDSGLPFAGPELLTRPGRPENELLGNQQLVTYLLANRQEEKFLAATLNATTAAPIILTTGEPVMALGGFSGGDRILSADELAGLVAEDTVRFFLLPSRNGRQSDLTDWVTTHCPVVPAELWQATPEDFNGPPQAGPAGSLQLFDCSGGTL